MCVWLEDVVPIYDYECASCGNQFELRQGFDSEPVETCPRCQGRAQRRFHSPVVIYKGSGFYTTDYGHKTVSEPSKSSESASPKIPASSSAPSSTPADGSAGESKATEGSKAKESPTSTV
ncbi:MAG: zinc ribbon domain-containing protein [Dehalococcoidia bacterium]|nr:zinc ribbon domain-containing protein [Dehalococcoidia bacterium]